MSRAAIPQRVAEITQCPSADCPPGHRFGLYFPVWGDDRWEIDPGAKSRALRECLKLGAATKMLEAIRGRQEVLVASLGEDRVLVVDAISTAPLATGLGLEHAIENGFAFLSPYGLPYLAGSGVKGVLRRAAEELRDEGDPVIAQPWIERLFGHEDAADARRGALVCWDVFPQPPGASLIVEIMTPHLTHYYQKGDPPHDSGQPNPIPFLAVPPKSSFCFVFEYKGPPCTDSEGNWKDALNRIIERAFDWLGFGAKTSVGYGALEHDSKGADQRHRREEERRQQAAKRAAAERERRKASLSPAMQKIEDFIDAYRKRFEQLRGLPDNRDRSYHEKAKALAEEAAGWAPADKEAVAKAIEEWLPKVVARIELKTLRKAPWFAALRAAAQG